MYNKPNCKYCKSWILDDSPSVHWPESQQLFMNNDDVDDTVYRESLTVSNWKIDVYSIP